MKQFESNPSVCYICVPFGSGEMCQECAQLTNLERETKLTDTLLAEIVAEETD